MPTSGKFVFHRVMFVMILSRPMHCYQPPGSCQWNYDVCSVAAPVEPDPNHVHWDRVINLTDELRQYNITNIKLNGYSDKPEQYYGYPYIVKVQVVCNGLDSHEIGRKLAQVGLKPSIFIRTGPVNTLGEYRAYTEHFLSPILVDQAKMSQTSQPTCVALLCEPVWLVPLVRDWRYNVFTVEIKETYLGSLTIRARINEEVNTVGPVKEPDHILAYRLPNMKVVKRRKRAESVEVGNNLLNTVEDDLFQKHVRFKYISGRSILLGFAGFKKNLIILSYDFFATYSVVEVNLPPARPSVACSNTNGVSVLDLLALNNIILLHTQSGIYELDGYQNTVLGKKAHVSIVGCFKMVFMSEQPLNQRGAVVAIGDQGIKGQIYAADTSENNREEGLNFVLLRANNTSDPCSLFTDYNSCSIVSGSVTITPELVITFLVQLVSLQGRGEVGILEFSGNFSQGHWRCVSQFSAVYYEKQRDILQYFYLNPRSSMSGNKPGVPVHIHSVIYSRYVGSHLSFLGNAIVESFDRGRLVFLIKKTFNETVKIVSFDNTEHGLYAYLNSNNEIWLGQVGVHVIKLTNAWNIYHDLSIREDTYVSDSISDRVIAIFFHGKDLYKLIAYKTSSGDVFLRRLLVPYAEALSGDALAKSFPLGESVIKVNYGCPFRDITFESRGYQKYSRMEKYLWAIPTQAVQYAGLQTRVSLLVANALIHRLMVKEVDIHHKHFFDGYTDHIHEWHQSRAYITPYLKYLFRNSRSSSAIEITDTGLSKVFDDEIATIYNRIPEYIYLDVTDVYTFKVWMTLETSHRIDTNMKPLFEIDDLILSIIPSNSSLLKVVLQTKRFRVNRTVLHTVSFVPKLSVVPKQSPAGQNLLPVSVIVKAWNSDFKCFFKDNYELQMRGLYSTTVLLGCPPETFLVFNNRASLKELKRYKEKDYGCIHEEPPLTTCLYYQNGFYPVFRIVDRPTGTSKYFDQLYTLKVVAGGNHRDALRNFTEDEIKAFNSIGPKYTELKSQVLAPIDENSVQTTTDGFPVYTQQHNQVRWVCREHSPCGNIIPVPFNTPEFYFVLEVSNNGLNGKKTFCDHTLRFLVKVYGLPLAIIPTDFIIRMSFIFAIIMGIAIYFVATECKRCSRNKDTNSQENKEQVISAWSHEQMDPSSCSNIHLDKSLPKVQLTAPGAVYTPPPVPPNRESLGTDYGKTVDQSFGSDRVSHLATRRTQSPSVVSTNETKSSVTKDITTISSSRRSATESNDSATESTDSSLSTVKTTTNPESTDRTTLTVDLSKDSSFVVTNHLSATVGQMPPTQRLQVASKPADHLPHQKIPQATRGRGTLQRPQTSGQLAHKTGISASTTKKSIANSRRQNKRGYVESEEGLQVSHNANTGHKSQVKLDTATRLTTQLSKYGTLTSHGENSHQRRDVVTPVNHHQLTRGASNILAQSTRASICTQGSEGHATLPESKQAHKITSKVIPKSPSEN